MEVSLVIECYICFFLKQVGLFAFRLVSVAQNRSILMAINPLILS